MSSATTLEESLKRLKLVTLAERLDGWLETAAKAGMGVRGVPGEDRRGGTVLEKHKTHR
ncbi:hypothetical protein B1B_12159, partial [mine drainage metagenome]